VYEEPGLSDQAGLVRVNRRRRDPGKRRRRFPDPAPLTPNQSMLQFLRPRTQGDITMVRMRRTMPFDWAGWRFRADGCEATAVPLPTGGDFDLDARRRTRRGSGWSSSIAAGSMSARP